MHTARLLVTAEQGADGTGRTLAADAAGEDARLLARIASGDPEAFRRIVERYLPLVVAVGRRILGDDAEAEDVAQDVMLRVWRMGGRLELGPYGLKPWLRRVATNLAIDRFRSRRRTDLTDELPDVPDAARQETGLQAGDLATRVAAALAELPERQRLALTLFHFEGLSQSDVAAALGVSDEAVESLLARGRRTLKTSLGGVWRDLLPDGPA